MRRLLSIALLTIGVAAADAHAQPPLPGVPPPPHPARVVRDIDSHVRAAAYPHRRVRRRAVRRGTYRGRHRALGHRARASALVIRPPVSGLPVLRVPPR
jgi:hypothetical protein